MPEAQAQPLAPAAHRSARFRFIRGTVGILLAAAILYHFVSTLPFDSIRELPGRIRWGWIVGGGGITLLAFWLLRAFRWRYLLGVANHRIPFLGLYFCNTISLGLAILTPLQAGETMKVEWLKSRGLLDRETGYGIYVFERFLDIGTILSLGFILILVRFRDVLSQLKPPSTTAWLLFLTGVTVFGGAALILVRRHQDRLRAEFALRRERLKVFLSARVLLISILQTLGLWTLAALNCQCCWEGVGLRIDTRDVICIITVNNCINALNIVPLGIGIQEFSLVKLLMLYGPDLSSAFAGAIILRLFSLFYILFSVAHLGVWRVLPEKARARFLPVRAAEPTGESRKESGRFQ